MDNNKNIQSILQQELEKEIPSSEIKLWGAVRATLVAEKYALHQQGETMSTINPRRIARLAVVTLVIITLLALALITPQGRAFAQSILQFFIRSESDVIPVPTENAVAWVDLTASVPPATMTPSPHMAVFVDECGDFPNPTCTVEQIRNKVNFTIKEPGRIPEGLYFIGATGGPDSVYLGYTSPDHTTIMAVFAERWTGSLSPQTDLVGASATVEKVQIGDLTGEYFKGSFVYEDGQDIAIWDPDFQTETLRWAESNTSYRMIYSSQTSLQKEGMLALAETMTLQPVAKLPLPLPAQETPVVWDPGEVWNLSVSEAEQQAGFKLMMPATVPDVLSLFGARYDAKYNMPAVYYRFEQDGMPFGSDGLVLQQQVVLDPSDCDLCDIVVGDYNALKGDATYAMVVPPDANLETVQIGDSTGQYVEGVWSGTDCCGWVWEPGPYVKTLRWWVDGRAFELSYFGMDINKMDMIRIAESMK